MSAASFIRLPKLSLLAMACALSLGASQAQAQSLTELYDTARSYDAAYLASRALAESAQARADQIHALRRPSLGLALSASRTKAVSPTGETNASGPEASLSGRQSLFNRANDVTIDQADRSVEAARADLETAEQELIVRVAQNYFDVLGAQDTLTTARANKTAISEQLASAKRNFEVGTATITDTREAQARYDLSTAQEIAADNDLRTKRIALDQLVGRINVQPLPLATPVVLPAIQPNNVEDWVAQTEQSPSVRKAVVGYEVARLETEKARAGHLPTLDLTGGYNRGRTHADGTQGQQGFDYSGPTRQSSVAITLNVPLFAGFSVQNRIKETLSLEEQARNNLDAARRGVAQATRQVFFAAQSGQAQVGALEASESSSKLALEATQLGYKVGVRVNLDVLNAQTQLFTTQRDLAKARYDVLLANLRLRQAAGQLKAADIAAVNQVLAK